MSSENNENTSEKLSEFAKLIQEAKKAKLEEDKLLEEKLLEEKLIEDKKIAEKEQIHALSETEKLSEFAKLIKEGKQAKKVEVKLEVENKKKQLSEKFKLNDDAFGSLGFLSDLVKAKSEKPITVVENPEYVELPPIVEEPIVEPVVEPTPTEVEEVKVVEEAPKPVETIISRSVKAINKISENTNLLTTTPVDKTEANFKSVQEKLKFLEQWVAKISTAGAGSGSYWLNDLGDTDKLSIKGASDGQVLTFSSTLNKWIAADANVGPGGPSIDQYARNTANSASSNTIITQGVDATQNTNISNADTKAQAAFEKANNALANTGGTITGDLTVVGTDYNKGIMLTGSRANIYIGNDARDARTVLSLNSLSNYYSGIEINRVGSELWFAGADTTEKFVIRRINSIDAVTVNNTTGLVNIADSLIVFGNVTANGVNLSERVGAAFGVANSASSNTVVTQGVDATQNTNIASAQLFANSAFTKANTAITTSGGTITGSLTVNGTTTSNSSTAFYAGDAAVSAIALSMPKDGALRDRTNGASTMYFDVSNGGTTDGTFTFRSSSNFTTVLAMNPTQFNVNTNAVVTARTASIGRLPWNSAIDSELTVDEYRFRVTNSGGIYPQIISDVSGQTKNSAWTAVAAISGSAVTQGGSTGTLVPNNAWTSLYTFGSMNSAGDTVTVTLQDKARGRIYRVTFMRSDNGSTTGYNIIAERLL